MRQRRAAVRHRSAPDQLRGVGATRGSGSMSAPTSRWPTPWRARSSPPACANQAFIERATTGFEDYRASVEPYTLEHAEEVTGVPGGGDSRTGARLRPRRPRADLLDARDHGAPQRRRQRAGHHQPGAAHRACRALRLRPHPAAGPEQRPGRRRHGRHPEQVPRRPGRRGSRAPREVRARLRPDASRPRGDGI